MVAKSIAKQLLFIHKPTAYRSNAKSLFVTLTVTLPMNNNDTYLSKLVDGFRVQSRGDHGWPPLACGILSSSSDIERCRAVVSGVIWIRL